MPTPRLTALGVDWPHRERSEIIDAGGMGWHVQRFGETGPVILLLHGTGASAHSFAKLAPLLARSAQVVVPDLPGHGASDTPRQDGLTLPGMARRIGALCASLGVQPDVIVGHSAGAAIAIETSLDELLTPRLIVGLNAALQPMQGYALFSPLAKALFLNPLVPMLFARSARRPSTARRLLDQTGSDIGEEGVELYRRLFSSREHVYGALGMMANWDLDTLRQRMSGLRVPLVLVTAADDRTIPARDAPAHARRVRDGRHVPLDHGGHLLHEQEPQRVAELVEELTRDTLADRVATPRPAA